MPRFDPWNDSLVWRLPMIDGGSGFIDGPGFDPPAPWTRALVAVGRDLRCLRYGRYADTDRLEWDLVIDGNYHVWIGWQGVRGIGGFGIGGALSMDATFGESATWVAEVVQDNLAGYDFVQWPSRGRHLLVPRLRAGEPVWVDPHGDVTVGPVGELCEHADLWRTP
ncbi:hypothetical protein GS966_12180 [Rhodococcus hoagii]|nr:hypothetical protein [Prescottella equi]NKR56888.1 hypothetical protein [Prescottella equi]NKS32111.1 hypothetical protein [Prescottella equi]NKS39006.1 hypothetical protein [Prescottella equi]NKS63513.1 hypothetical protein [Prescottella equi]